MQVRIAILDNGINQYTFSGRLVGNLFVNDNKELEIERSSQKIHGYVHGTSCALIINKYCSKAVFSSIRVLDDNGKGMLDKIQPALEWCYQNNVRLVNLSLGTTHFQDKATIRDVINYYANKGMLIVAATANNDYMTYPASFSNVIGVAAGETFGIGDESHQQKGVDFIAPSGHEIMIGKDSVKLAESNSYAAPYVTSMIGNLLMQEYCINVCQIRKKISPGISEVNFLYSPDWIEIAWVSEQCCRSEAGYYFKEVKGELMSCISEIDTIVISNREEFEKYHSKGKHMVYLGTEPVEFPFLDKHYWSTEQRVAQINGCKERISDINIPVIVCNLDEKQDIIFLLSELKDYFSNDGYNVYAISNKVESVLYDLEFFPEELCSKSNSEQIHNFIYWQTYYQQMDAVLFGVYLHDSFDLGTLKISADMIVYVDDIDGKVETKVFYDENMKMDETFDYLNHKTIGIIYQKIIKLFTESVDEP